ncbi:hypothetical protein A6U87_26610 [Rhizobium sp. AC44/96]|uniref:hypothetical protein n=1 Tax=Rhizobium sp. AC44/96 TaxID=1841654 RepID=UPI00080FC7F1|nr:hypothetical protein [Rhizobium sp. AC44/96]OCJ14068.1 hypothetical protein A6U87_26610 [Rhizobium sp. AC44/96]
MTSSNSEPSNAGRLSARDKADATDQAAREIVAAEVKAREKKTEMLKALRLQQIATDGADAPPKRAKASRTKT